MILDVFWTYIILQFLSNLAPPSARTVIDIGLKFGRPRENVFVNGPTKYFDDSYNTFWDIDYQTWSDIEFSTFDLKTSKKRPVRSYIMDQKFKSAQNGQNGGEK